MTFSPDLLYDLTNNNSLSISLLLLIIGFGFLYVRPFSSKSPYLRVLPGPPGLPLVGNLFQIPKKRPWLQMTEWAKLYGQQHHQAHLEGLSMTTLLTLDAPSHKICTWIFLGIQHPPLFAFLFFLPHRPDI